MNNGAASVIGRCPASCLLDYGVSVKSAVLLTPLSEAVIVTDRFAETVLDVTVNVAVVLPAVTVTEIGSEAFELLSARFTVRPPVGAGPDSRTVPVADVPPLNEVGLTEAEISTGRSTVNVVFTELPLKVAVTATLVSVATATVEMLAEPVVDPAATVTVAGPLVALLFSERLTVRPPVGAATLSATVAVLAVAPVTDDDDIEMPLSDGGVIVTIVVAEPLSVAAMVAVT
jgi:hypothetical protein